MAFLKVKNRAISSLASGVNDVVTEWTLATGEGALFPTSGDFHVTCEDEIVKCTARSDDVLTVVRAQEGTAAAAHDSGKAVKLQITAGIIEEIQSVLDGGITGAHLSQDFGAGGGRLLRYVPIPISNYFLAAANVGADSPFTAAINAAGSGGLTATNVPYDGDANENMFEGLYAYNGSTYWGQIVLHNTTRGNSRNIVSVDRSNNVITTTSSTDDWADDDVLTTASTTVGEVAFFDIDLSDFVTATMAAINISVYLSDVSTGATASRRVELHPYVTYDAGKKIQCYNALASQQAFISYIIPVTSQKVCLRFASHTDTFMTYRVSGYWEYADT